MNPAFVNGALAGVAMTAVEALARYTPDPIDARNKGAALLAAASSLMSIWASRRYSSPRAGLPNRLLAAAAGKGAIWAVRATALRLAPLPPDEGYNYRHFDAEVHRELDRLIAGRAVVDAELSSTAGEPIRLSSLYSNRTLVLEFGSVTCPQFLANVDEMEGLAEEFAGEAVFAVVGVREAHPGPRFPNHQSMAQKRWQASRLYDLDGVRRRLLVDGLDGEFHLRYGGWPNSLMVIGRDGFISYFGKWARPEHAAEALEHLLAHEGLGEAVPSWQDETPPIPWRGQPGKALHYLRPGLTGLTDVLANAPEVAWRRARGAASDLPAATKRALAG